ncbi:unnamed protein product, partial [Nesidiocoris tenuis]
MRIPEPVSILETWEVARPMGAMPIGEAARGMPALATAAKAATTWITTEKIFFY